MKSRFELLAAATLVVCGCFWVDTTEVVAPDAGGSEAGDGGVLSASWASTVGPALARACGACHDAATKTAGLDLTSYAGAMAKAGVVVAGNPSGSTIVQRLEAGTMPPSGLAGITAAELAALKQWILEGASNN